MNDKPGSLNYHLVFAGQHPKGLEKMKEAMMRIDQTGTYSFADDTVGPELFRFNFKDPATSARGMHKKFLGQTVSSTEVCDYVLNETPYVNPFKILEWLQARDQVEVLWIGQPPPRGFPKDKIAAVCFKTPAPQKPGDQLDLFSSIW